MTAREIWIAFVFALAFAILFFLVGYWVDHRERKRLKDDNKALRQELNFVVKTLREAIVELARVEISARSAEKFVNSIGELAVKLHNDWMQRKKGRQNDWTLGCRGARYRCVLCR